VSFNPLILETISSSQVKSDDKHRQGMLNGI